LLAALQVEQTFAAAVIGRLIEGEAERIIVRRDQTT
jgi:hypothetical protein